MRQDQFLQIPSGLSHIQVFPCIILLQTLQNVFWYFEAVLHCWTHLRSGMASLDSQLVKTDIFSVHIFSTLEIIRWDGSYGDRVCIWGAFDLTILSQCRDLKDYFLSMSEYIMVCVEYDPNDPGVLPSQAKGPGQRVRLPGQTKVTPDEYSEFLGLGHGDIFNLELDW